MSDQMEYLKLISLIDSLKNTNAKIIFGTDGFVYGQFNEPVGELKDKTFTKLLERAHKIKALYMDIEEMRLVQ